MRFPRATRRKDPDDEHDPVAVVSSDGGDVRGVPGLQERHALADELVMLLRIDSGHVLGPPLVDTDEHDAPLGVRQGADGFDDVASAPLAFELDRRALQEQPLGSLLPEKGNDDVSGDRVPLSREDREVGHGCTRGSTAGWN